MPVDSISANVSSLIQPPVTTGGASDKTASVDKPANVVVSTKDRLPGAAEIPGVGDAQAGDKLSFSSVPESAATVETVAKPAGVVSHVVESYNFKGDVRVKFMDSRNNVVYQIPSEMVAKMQDLMLKPNTSADIKG